LIIGFFSLFEGKKGNLISINERRLEKKRAIHGDFTIFLGNFAAVYKQK